MALRAKPTANLSDANGAATMVGPAVSQSAGFTTRQTPFAAGGRINTAAAAESGDQPVAVSDADYCATPAHRGDGTRSSSFSSDSPRRLVAPPCPAPSPTPT